MLSNIRNHPFGVDTHFQSSVVLTYAVDKSQLRPLLPACLEPDTFGNKWGFVAVAFVKAVNLRPSGFPTVLGQNFVLVGYRIFVRYTTIAGKRLRGLYILRSETNKHRMVILGNLFTKYHYHYADIKMTDSGKQIKVVSHRSAIDVEVVTSQDNNTSLPISSPFANWSEARKYAGPLPFTFSFDQSTNRVLIVEGQRSEWNPQPGIAYKANVPMIEHIGLRDLKLANVFVLRDVPYHWKKGIQDIWKP